MAETKSITTTTKMRRVNRRSGKKKLVRYRHAIAKEDVDCVLRQNIISHQQSHRKAYFTYRNTKGGKIVR